MISSYKKQKRWFLIKNRRSVQIDEMKRPKLLKCNQTFWPKSTSKLSQREEEGRYLIKVCWQNFGVEIRRLRFDVGFLSFDTLQIQLMNKKVFWHQKSLKKKSALQKNIEKLFLETDWCVNWNVITWNEEKIQIWHWHLDRKISSMKNFVLSKNILDVRMVTEMIKVLNRFSELTL